MGIKDLKKKWQYKRAAWRFRNRSITRAKVLYWYFIFGGVGMFLYAISCVFTGLSFWYTLSPIVLLIGYFLLNFIKRNWKIMWFYISDISRGKLLMYMSRYHHSDGDELRAIKAAKWIYLSGREKSKYRIINWIYSIGKTIRNERWLELSNKVREGIELSKSEKREAKCKIVNCPQQTLDGINKAFLIDSLKYAHAWIEILDDNLREILELTDENMMKFNLQDEVDRCKTKDNRDKIKKYKEKAMRILNNRKK